MFFKKRLSLMVVGFAMGFALMALSANVWNITVDSDTDQIQPVTREFARGESWAIKALVTDDGVPRVWPTNTTFLFFWQTPAMRTNWYVSTNVVWPVYANVTTTNLVPTVTTYITNSSSYIYYVLGTNGDVTTNIVPSVSTTNSFTSYVVGYVLTNVVDTGRVSAAWNATMDGGSSSYNWWIGGFDSQSNITYRVNGTITMRGAPGFGGTFNPSFWFYPWATTNYVNSIWGQMLWLSADTNNPGYFFLMSPN